MILIPLTCRQGISGVASVTSPGSLAAMSPSRPMTASPQASADARCPSASSQGSPARLPRRLPLPGLPGGHRLLWSQIHGLGADVIVPGLEGAPRNDVDSDAEEF